MALIQRMENAECAPTAVEVYVSDHGGEAMVSRDFQQFLVERSLQSLKATMCVLHIQSQLNYSYWPLTATAASMISVVFWTGPGSFFIQGVWVRLLLLGPSCFEVQSGGTVSTVQHCEARSLCGI